MSKTALVDLLKRSGAVQFGKFKLASGKESDYYVNLKLATSDPEILMTIADVVEDLVGETDRIGGPALGAVPIVVAPSLRLDKPFVIVRKEKKGHGTGMQIEGKLEKGDRVVVVEDVTTTAGSLVKAIKVLRLSGAVVEKAIVVVDRGEGARENVEAENVEFVSVLTQNDLKK